MKFFDLFAGIGGFRLALERNGHECIGSCEIDKYARNIYEKNFGNKPQEADARKIKPEWLPDFDILCAGFPCQAFSLAGKRLGFEDTRGTLYHEIIRIAKEKRPKYLLLENVKGLLYNDQNKTLATILGALDEIRYDAEWQVVNSKYFLPQNRERIFIVGHSREGSGRKILPVGDYGQESNKPSIKMLKNSSEDCYRIYDTSGVARTLRASAGGMGAKTGVYAEKKKMAFLSHPDGNIKNRIQDRDETWTLTGNPNDWGILEEEPHLLGWSKSTRDWGVESRIKSGEANTLNTGEGCRNQSTASFVLNNHRLRRLTPLECERLQGFPDGWTEGESDSQRYKMLGNAVTVPVVQYISSLMK